MKIVMLCDLYDEKRQYQENLFSRYYVKHGHEVTVLAATFKDAFDYVAHRYDPSVPPSVLWDEGVKVLKLPYRINFLNRLRKFRGVDAILEREKPDLIFSHDIHLNLVEAVRYKRRHPECRIIMDYHADFSNSAQNWLSLAILHKIVRKSVLKRYRPYIDKIYPVVPASADFLYEVYDIPHEEMELLPLGADTDLAVRTREERAGEEIRARFAIPADATLVFTGGKLSPTKRTHLLVEAIAASPETSLHLLVVGDANRDDAAYMQAMVERAAPSGRVHFAGWVDGHDVYRYMDACDLAVFPASQSVLWQQALSMGLPLVVGRVGVQDATYMNLYDNMQILDEPDITVQGITAAIEHWANDPAALAEAQQNALRAADELLNYHKLVAMTLDTE